MENPTPKPQTQIKFVVRRAAQVFGVLTVVTAVASTSAVYAGAKSGELEKDVVKPLQAKLVQIKDQVVKSLSESSSGSNPATFTTRSESRTEVIINNNGTTVKTNVKASGGTQVKINWVEPSWPTYPTYDEVKKSQDAWWSQVQAQNAALSAQSAADLEAFRQQSEQKLNDFKLQGQQGMADFEAQMQQMQADFLKQHGINQ